ncbi:MAG: hypothetical protein K8T10_13805 [Candidatus Eremiobacteraeota bacterium]|nr:hypothetical protein [Candidatus Eremiobacteraeota bacterium]
MHVTIDELVEKGFLRQVKVLKAPEFVMDYGKKQYPTLFKKQCFSQEGLPAFHCQDNSICVVKAMREKGEDDWHIVPGFAWNPNLNGPTPHLWVRKGKLHYDPTWSLQFFNFEFKNLEHYQLIQYLDTLPKEPEENNPDEINVWGKTTLKRLEDLAAQWGLYIHNQFSFTPGQLESGKSQLQGRDYGDY